MTEQYLMRWTCDICGGTAEGPGYSEGVPGWREVRTFTTTDKVDPATDGPEVITETHHYCSWQCERNEEALPAANIVVKLGY